MAKKLGFGLMRLPVLDPNDAGSIDIEQMKKMVDTFIEKGFTYFDTAWMYCGGKSEEATKEALTSRHARDTYTLTTKLPGYKIKSFEDRDKIFNAQLEKTGAGYFDYYLLHDVNTKTLPNFEKWNCFEWIQEKKAEGLIKVAGFSYHDGPELLDEILTKYPEIEIVQLQINYLDWNSIGVQSRKCYEVCVKHNKPVLVMEPIKGGTLIDVPEEVAEMFKAADPSVSPAEWAIRFVATLDNVKMVLSGMSTFEQLDQNTEFMKDFKPLTDAEIEMMHKAAEIINSTIAIPCTGCAYCVVNCPMNIAIPQYFSLYNADMQEREDKPWTAQSGYYANLTVNFGKASECIECGQCEDMCPQHLHIRDFLKDVAKHFEG